ncbi:hypothetical protein R3P38DRAFT_2570464 [Favolaschia claudopus]|uniref:Uncharacterized protein n=1 Tax=Favolaschia claudopus TaxID=2862362 RepID=A0AAV9ZTJ3_9AGAR
MQLFLQLVALVTLALGHQAMAQVTFVVAPTNANANCVPGTVISCGQTAINTGNCKGDFTPGQRCVHIASTHPGCHISLFTEEGQQGGVEASLSTASHKSVEASDDDAAWEPSPVRFTI